MILTPLFVCQDSHLSGCACICPEKRRLVLLSMIINDPVRRCFPKNPFRNQIWLSASFSVDFYFLRQDTESNCSADGSCWRARSLLSGFFRFVFDRAIISRIVTRVSYPGSSPLSPRFIFGRTDSLFECLSGPLYVLTFLD